MDERTKRIEAIATAVLPSLIRIAGEDVDLRGVALDAVRLGERLQRLRRLASARRARRRARSRFWDWNASTVTIVRHGRVVSSAAMHGRIKRAARRRRGGASEEGAKLAAEAALQRQGHGVHEGAEELVLAAPPEHGVRAPFLPRLQPLFHGRLARRRWWAREAREVRERPPRRRRLVPRSSRPSWVERQYKI